MVRPAWVSVVLWVVRSRPVLTTDCAMAWLALPSTAKVAKAVAMCLADRQRVVVVLRMR
jgi:hypothetical protein